jgi:hypothetical protein
MFKLVTLLVLGKMTSTSSTLSTFQKTPVDKRSLVVLVGLHLNLKLAAGWKHITTRSIDPLL